MGNQICRLLLQLNLILFHIKDMLSKHGLPISEYMQLTFQRDLNLKTVERRYVPRSISGIVAGRSVVLIFFCPSQ